MDSRFKKVIAGASAVAISLTQIGTVLAAYSDVPAGVWYEDAVERFIDAGYLDETQPRFRGADFANRAEFVKLIVELNGGVLSTPPAVPSFTDVAPSAWYYGYFEEAGKEGWVKGDNNCYGSSPCYARPGANIVRAEAGALIVRAFGLQSLDLAPQFVDNASGQWYTDSIQTAADHCVLQGDDGTGRVRPGDPMNRAEMVVMLDRVDQGLTFGVDCGRGASGEPLITDVMGTSATTIEVEFNVALDADSAEDAAAWSVTCDGQDIAVTGAVLTDTDVVELTLGSAMSPNADCSVSVDGLMTAEGEEFSDSLDFEGYSPIAIGDGILEVSLSASNPVADTLPRGAVGVVMLSADLTASCDDSVIIEDITVLHEGFGSETDIDGLYAAIDGARVSRKRTIDSEDQTAELRFASPLVIDPCESVTVDIVGDFNSTATVSGEHNLVLELASDVVSNAKDVTGTFPLRGNTFRVAAVTSGTVTVTYRSVTPNQVEVGDTGVVLGKFEVSSNSVEDQTFYSMTLENNGSASDGDFVNLAIRRTDGTVLTNTVASTVGDFVTLVFDPPFTVLEGDKITLEVIGDIVGGPGDTVQLAFEESSDVFAVGSLYGYGVNGQLYGSQVVLSTTPGATSISIDAGQFTIGIDGPAQQDYTRDDNDAVLANVEFETGGEQIDVKEMFVAVQGRTSTGAGLAIHQNTTSDNIHEVLEDVELRNTVTGRTIDGVRLTTTEGTDGNFFTSTTETFQIYRFDDFIVHGSENWELRTDFIDNGASEHPMNGDQFRAHICGAATHTLNTSGTLVANTATCTFGGLIAATTAYQMEVEGLSTGDTVGDIRPGTDIAGNFHNIANAQLTIAVKALASTDSTVENAKDIRLFRFEARSGEAEDVLLTKFVFSGAIGDAKNMSSYALWVDSDGDGTVDTALQSGVSAQGTGQGPITFDELTGGGFVVPAEETVLFEVHGDVSTSPITSTFRLGFATQGITYIEAEELDDGSNLSGISTNGTCSTAPCDIVVTTTEGGIGGTLFTIRTSGDLYVERDTTLPSRQLLGSTVDDPVLRLAFSAQNEDIDVTGIKITGSGAAAARSIESLQLFLGSATTPFATANVAGCGSVAVPVAQTTKNSKTFCAQMNNNQLVVDENSGDVIVTVRPVVKNNNSGGGASSGELLSFLLAAGPESNTGTVITARGEHSSNDLTLSDRDGTSEGEIFIHPTAAGPTSAGQATIEGSNNQVVMSQVVSITNANPDANGTNVPTSDSPVGQFTFTSAAHSNNGNEFTMSGIIFNVVSTNVAISTTDIEFYNKDNSTIKSTCQAYNSAGTLITTITQTGSFVVKCDAPASSNVDVTIGSGQSSTFVLELDITNPQVVGTNASTLQVALQQFNDITRTSYGVTNSHINWNDVDDLNNTAEFHWIEYPETEVKSTSYST